MMIHYLILELLNWKLFGNKIPNLDKLCYLFFNRSLLYYAYINTFVLNDYYTWSYEKTFKNSFQMPSVFRVFHANFLKKIKVFNFPSKWRVSKGWADINQRQNSRDQGETVTRSFVEEYFQFSNVFYRQKNQCSVVSSPIHIGLPRTPVYNQPRYNLLSIIPVPNGRHVGLNINSVAESFKLNKT